jgi:hypothetical protein
MYRFQVLPPTISTPVSLAGSLLWLELLAGNATAASSAYRVQRELPSVVGSNITVNVWLKDKYGNAAVASNTAQLALQGERCST